MVWLFVRVCIDNTVGVHCKRENLFHFISTGTVKATTKSSKDFDYSWVIIGFNSCEVDGEEQNLCLMLYMQLYCNFKIQVFVLCSSTLYQKIWHNKLRL